MATSNKIIIYEDGKSKELSGEELNLFLEQQKKDLTEQRRIEAELQAKQATLDSAIAKLAKLGLTEDEAKAIIGIQ